MTTKVCDHSTVTADILEGDAEGLCVQWCQECGSYRRGTWHLLSVTYSDWTCPQGVETALTDTPGGVLPTSPSRRSGA